MVKALNCDLKNLGLIPSATASPHAFGQIAECLSAQLTVQNEGSRSSF